MNGPEESQNVEQVIAPEVEPTQEVETAEVEQVETPAQADDSGFEAGFNSAIGIEEPAPEPEPEELVFAGYKESEIKALLERVSEIDKLKEREAKVFGTIGSIKQQVDTLKNAAPQTVKLNPDGFKRLSAEFPELAQMLTEDLGEAIQSAPGVVPEASKQFEERLQEVERKAEMKLLTVMQPDWKKVVPSEEFQKWKETLDESVRTELDSSWDSTFIAERIREFKDWKGKAEQAKQNKQRRLETNVTPQGAPRPTAPSDEDEFLAGYKAARGIT